ncbi:unnamed protein product [Ostreobium quekettii]|uniref:Uncharacterized protein n=1 Tax=Ostreobium quekettii TaxID=121088 RepID=A0A8S1IKF0_9CHLO|nr:unnamed protein product [Ostreobium quekettii]
MRAESQTQESARRYEAQSTESLETSTQPPKKAAGLLRRCLLSQKRNQQPRGWQTNKQTKGMDGHPCNKFITIMPRENGTQGRTNGPGALQGLASELLKRGHQMRVTAFRRAALPVLQHASDSAAVSRYPPRRA